MTLPSNPPLDSIRSNRASSRITNANNKNPQPKFRQSFPSKGCENSSRNPSNFPRKCAAVNGTSIQASGTPTKNCGKRPNRILHCIQGPSSRLYTSTSTRYLYRKGIRKMNPLTGGQNSSLRSHVNRRGGPSNERSSVSKRIPRAVKSPEIGHKRATDARRVVEGGGTDQRRKPFLINGP